MAKNMLLTQLSVVRMSRPEKKEHIGEYQTVFGYYYITSLRILLQQIST